MGGSGMWVPPKGIGALMCTILLRWISSRDAFRLMAIAAACGWLTLPTWSANAQNSTLLFSESFENGWNGWTNDTTYTVDKRYAWAICVPTNRPAAAHSGSHCAGTLDPGTDCYLVSPPLALPAANQYSNHIWLFYWQWQKYAGVCISDVKIRQRQYSPIGDYWGPWNIIDPGTSGVIDNNSPAWRRRGIDLTLFSGGIVQLGFGHSGTGDPGWFVDDVEVWDVPILTNWPGVESFENGWGAWHAYQGAWDIGTPVPPGPSACPDGSHCAGTGLAGVPPTVYMDYLWSPAFYLPALKPGERAYLQFDLWYDYPNAFCTSVHWSQWWSSIGWTWPQTIDAELLIATTQRKWFTASKDISRLAGMILPIRLGIGHGNVSTNGLGAFIDNVRITIPRLQLKDVHPQGNDLSLSWTALGGTTNVLQSTPSLAITFTNLSPPIVATGIAEVTSTFNHTGAATNRSMFYRVRQLDGK